MSTSLGTVYCSVCQRHVPVAETTPPLHDGEANLTDAQVVCLGFGEPCSGARCPVSGYPSVVMGVQLARSGILPESHWTTVRTLCQGCGEMSDLEMVGDAQAFCPICRTTNQLATH